MRDSDPANLKIIFKKLDELDLDILATIEELSIIPTVTSRRGIKSEEIVEKLKIKHENLTVRLVALKEMGLLDVVTNWVSTITPKGLRLLEEHRKSS